MISVNFTHHFAHQRISAQADAYCIRLQAAFRFSGLNNHCIRGNPAISSFHGHGDDYGIWILPHGNGNGFLQSGILFRHSNHHIAFRSGPDNGLGFAVVGVRGFLHQAAIHIGIGAAAV